MNKLTVYAKKTCITCQKALAFLDEQKVAYDLKDIVSDPPPKAVLEAALDEKNIKAGLNSRSAIYKEKNLGAKIPSKAEAIKLMLQDPNLIKRPVIVKPGIKTPYLGFEPDTLKAFLK